MPLPEIEIIEQVEAPELLQVIVEAQELHDVLTELHQVEAVEAIIEVVRPHPEVTEVLDEAQEATNQEVLYLAEITTDLQAGPVLEVTVAAVQLEVVREEAIEAREAVPEEALA